MAEYVQYRTEETIPELEQMERIKLFEKHEIKAIANRRKEFEYKIQRQTKCKEDYLRYIQYEMDLLKLIKLRRDKTRVFVKKSEIEHAITNRVDKLFKQVIQRFQSDIKLWISHIKFCTEVGFTVAVGAIFIRLLAVHSDKPNLWKLAANWEFNENHSIENARKFLLRALRFHPESKTIYKEAFRMELNFANQERHLKAEEEEERRGYALPDVKTEEDVDPILEGRLAEVIYDSAVDKIAGAPFCVDLLNIAMEFDFVDNLQNKIMNRLLTCYRDDELVWDVLARRSLEGFVMPDLSDETCTEPRWFMMKQINQTKKEKINACVNVYMSALENIKTEKLWSLYLNCLIELNQDLEKLPNLKKLLITGFDQAHTAGMLSEEYYLQWLDLARSKGDNDKVTTVLEMATERFPKNVDLWHRYLCCHLGNKSDEATGLAVFEKALVSVGCESEATLPLWTQLIQYYQRSDEDKAEQVFERAIMLGTEISLALKPFYLDWLCLMKGIESTRAAYQRLCLLPPLTVDLHKKMIMIECCRREVDMKYARKCFDSACHQFGGQSHDLWLDYVKFELQTGSANFVSNVYDKAVKTLEADQVELFVTKYSLIKSGTVLS